MKNEELALPSIPAAWKSQSLANIAAVFTDGDWIESKDQADSGVRLVQTGNVGIGHFKDRFEKARFIDEPTFSRLKCFEVIPGDILISRLPDPVGRACIIPDTGQKMITAVDCSIVRVRDAAIDAKFLVYYSQTQDYLRAVDFLCSGTTRRRISRKNLGDVSVPIPPLEEQKRIVAVLDQAFAALDRARAHAETNLADAEELLEVSKNEVIQHSRAKGQLVSLADVTSIDSTLVDPRQPEFSDMRHIGAGNMVSGTDALVDVMTARQEGLKSGKYLFDETMVLYSKIRPYLRKVARPDFTGICSADVYPLSPSPKLDRDFLFHVLHTKDFTEYAISGSDRAGMPKVNREHLFKYEFWLPPLAVQLESASKIDLVMEATGRLKASLRLKLSQIANLRQSLLQKGFSGQLA